MKYVFVMLLNLASGEQHETRRLHGLTFEQCDAMQRAVWRNESATIVGIDEQGRFIMRNDAYCVAEGDFHAR